MAPIPPVSPTHTTSSLIPVRGPKSALRFQTLLNKDADSDGNADATQLKAKKPEVLVLKGGFAAFQERYGKDKTLVVDYDEAFWREFA